MLGHKSSARIRSPLKLPPPPPPLLGMALIISHVFNSLHNFVYFSAQGGEVNDTALTEVCDRAINIDTDSYGSVMDQLDSFTATSCATAYSHCL